MPEPTATPTATPTPPAPAPKPSAPSGGATPPSDPFKSLDSKLIAPTPPKQPEPTTPEPKPEPKPGERTVAPSKEDRTVRDVPKVLREQLDRTSGELKTARDQVKLMETKIADYESRGKDTTALSEQLTKLERERDNLRSRLAGVDFRATDDYQNTYEKPYQQAALKAKNLVERLNIKDPALGMDENGEPRTRKATWDDFARLFSLPEGTDVIEARELFGNISSLVENHLIRLKELYEKKETAAQEQTQNWKEKETEKQVQRTRQLEGYQQMLATVTDDLAQNVEWYHDTPDDSEGKGLRDEGYAVFDAQPQSMGEAAVKNAHVRHRVGAYGPLVRRVQAAEAKVAERDATIAEMKKARPGKTGSSGETVEGEGKSLAEELRDELGKA